MSEALSGGQTEILPELSAAAAWHRQAVALASGGRLTEALVCFRQVTELAPLAPVGWINLANALRTTGDAVGASAALRDALGRAPDSDLLKLSLAVALKDQGTVLKAENRLDEAIACFRESLTLSEGAAATWSDLGDALRIAGGPAGAGRDRDADGSSAQLSPRSLEQLAEAVECQRRAVAISPDEPRFSANLVASLNIFGWALHVEGALERAASTLREVVRLAPGEAEGWARLGEVLRAMKRFESAIECQRRVIALLPGRVQPLLELGVTFDRANRSLEAVETFEQALALQPGDRQLTLYCGLNRLRMGDYRRGWPQYEARLQPGGVLVARDLPGPSWKGTPFPGQRLMIALEQGFGDAIWAARFVPRAKALGGTVILEAEPALVRLFGISGVADQIVGRGEGLPPADTHAYMCSLAGLFTPDAGAISGEPYLSVPTSRHDALAAKIPVDDWLRVGIVWSGNTGFQGNADRAVPLQYFLDAFDLPGVRLFSLQKGPPAAELHAIPEAPVIDLAPVIGDFGETATAVAAMDLIIMTDSAVAHLAGALGKPVWVLLGNSAHWIWHEHGSTTRWYDSVRLFRQKVGDGWPDVFDSAAAALLRLIETRRRA